MARSWDRMGVLGGLRKREKRFGYTVISQEWEVLGVMLWTEVGGWEPELGLQ